VLVRKLYLKSNNIVLVFFMLKILDTVWKTLLSGTQCCCTYLTFTQLPVGRVISIQ